MNAALTRLEYLAASVLELARSQSIAIAGVQEARERLYRSLREMTA